MTILKSQTSFWCCSGKECNIERKDWLDQFRL